MPIKMNSPVVYIEHPTEKDNNVLSTGIDAYAIQRGIPCHGNKGFFYAAFDNEKIIAAISGFDNFGIAEITGLWVDEHFRRNGYGKSLVCAAEDWAKEKSLAGLSVCTFKDWPACTWYQSLGFTVEFERLSHSYSLTSCYLIKIFDN